MAEQRRIGYKWNLRTVMAQRNLWKSTELMPLLESRASTCPRARSIDSSPAPQSAFQLARSPPYATSLTARPTTCSSRTSRCAQPRPRTRRDDPRTSA